MRALLLTFAALVVSAASSACTQSNVQLPPFYDGGGQGNVDASTVDATEDGPTGTDAANEAATEASTGDAHAEAASDAAGGSEGGPSDAGDGGG